MNLRTLCPLLTALLLSGCGQPDSTLVVTGSSTIAPVFTEIATQFEDAQDVRVDVQSGGSGRGIQDAAKRLSQLGMASRALTESERNMGLIEHTLAWDGIALIVHRDNPIMALDRQQIRALYTGEFSSWADIGAASMPVVIINKAEGRSTLELFLQAFELENADIQADIVAGENQQVILSVAGNPGALGYVSIGAALAAEQAGTAIRTLPLDGVPANVASVRTGQWPLRRPLNLLTLGPAQGQTAALIDFALHDQAARALLEQYYFVPAAN